MEKKIHCYICDRLIDEANSIETTTVIGGIGKEFTCCKDCLKKVYEMELHRLFIWNEEHEQSNARNPIAVLIEKHHRKLKR